MVNQRDDNACERPMDGKLGSLRWLLRGRLIGEGVGWLVLTLVALIAVSLTMDYLLRLDRPLRIGLLCVCVAVGGWALWRAMLAPLCVKLTTLDLAQLVERHYPALQDRLVSALQFRDRQTVLAAGYSGAMMDCVVEQADELTESLNFRSVVETRRLRNVALGALGALLLFGGFSFAKAYIMGIWFQRNVLLAEVDWPQDTYLSVWYFDAEGQLLSLRETDATGNVLRVSGKLTALRGAPLEILVETAEGSEAPPNVQIHATYPSMGKTQTDAEKITGEELDALRERLGVDRIVEGRTYYRKKIVAAEEFEFYVTGGDDARDERTPHHVVLLSPPTLTKTDFWVTTPAFMRAAKPRQRIDGSRSVLPLPLGVRVDIDALATKDISEGAVLIDGKVITKLTIHPTQGPDGTGGKRRVTGSFDVVGENRPRTAKLTFRLRDTDGFSNTHGASYVLQYLPDLAPTVTLRSIGVRAVICPSARIPLTSLARDDHGVASIKMQWTLFPAPRDPAAPGEASTKPGQSITSPLGEPTLAEEGAGQELQARAELDFESLGELRKQIVPGARLTLTAEACDRLPASLGGPNISTSSPLQFRVISKQQLLAELVGKQREIRTEFLEAMLTQELSRGRGEAILADWKAEAIGVDTPRKLQDAMEKQLAVANESATAADALAAIAKELELNRAVPVKEYREIQTNVVLPLREVTSQMRAVCSRLDRVRAETAPEALREALIEIVAEQGRIYAKMEAILQNMRKLENRMELAHRFEGLLKLAVELEGILGERVDENTGGLFDPDSPDSPDSPDKKNKKDKKDEE